jgi:hypothetical protein
LENKGLQQYQKALEVILVMPMHAFIQQHEQNQKDLVLKKLVTEIINSKTMEDTAMDINTQVTMNLEMLQDFIQKESEKRDKKYQNLAKKYDKLQKDFNNLSVNNHSKYCAPQKNGHQGGWPHAPNNQNNSGNKNGRASGRNGSQQRGCQWSTSRLDSHCGNQN